MWNSNWIFSRLSHVSWKATNEKGKNRSNFYCQKNVRIGRRTKKYENNTKHIRLDVSGGRSVQSKAKHDARSAKSKHKLFRIVCLHIMLHSFSIYVSSLKFAIRFSVVVCFRRSIGLNMCFGAKAFIHECSLEHDVHTERLIYEYFIFLFTFHWFSLTRIGIFLVKF